MTTPTDRYRHYFQITPNRIVNVVFSVLFEYPKMFTTRNTSQFGRAVEVAVTERDRTLSGVVGVSLGVDKRVRCDRRCLTTTLLNVDHQLLGEDASVGSLSRSEPLALRFSLLLDDRARFPASRYSLWTRSSSMWKGIETVRKRTVLPVMMNNR